MCLLETYLFANHSKKLKKYSPFAKYVNRRKMILERLGAARFGEKHGKVFFYRKDRADPSRSKISFALE